jgi:hypothetical protein
VKSNQHNSRPKSERGVPRIHASRFTLHFIRFGSLLSSVAPSPFVIRHSSFVIFACLLISVARLPAAIDETKLPPASTNRIDFVRDIKPILDDHCLKCHGPSKPKSGFRVDDREALLKGGENGKDVIPGHSAKSPLIHFVTRLVEDMQMPPTGKGEPLTPPQIGLLRAWIDQGVEWGGPPASHTRVDVSPMVRWVSVTGDEQRFREHHWFREGLSGGVERFELQQDIDSRTRVITSGRALSDDISVTLSLERDNVGFVRGGAENARKWYDDSGGYYERFATPQYDLHRDLYLDTGRFWVEAGATAPFGTQFKAGYEYRYRDGEKALTRWLPVTENGVTRNILPNAKEIDERLNLLRFDVTHEWSTLRLADNFRYEFYDLDTRHYTVSPAQSNTDPLQRILEQHRIDTLANAFTVEKLFTDWLLFSGGYLYTHLDGDTTFSQRAVDQGGNPVQGNVWSGQGITLKRDAHVMNFNTRLGPWKGLTGTAGLQTEWNSQDAFGPLRLDEPDPNDPTMLQTNRSFGANSIDRVIWQERAGVRYTSIPYTVLYAEGDWRQENIDQHDELIPGLVNTHDAFRRDADLDKHWRRYRSGFDVSPWARVSLNAWYQYFDKRTDFDEQAQDLTLYPPMVLPGIGYPGFLTRQDITTDEVGARLVLRPSPWLKTTFSYRVVATDYRTWTKRLAAIVPGGEVLAGNYDAQILGFNATLTPWQRLRFFGSFTYQNTRTVTADNGNASIAPFKGDIYSALTSATFVLNQRTDLSATYDFSSADYAQHNAAAGLPLGLEYQLHTLRAGVTRSLTKNLRVRIEYFFSLYDEPYSAGLNDYVAHGVFGTLNFHWQ